MQRLQNSIQRESSDLLAGREFPERADELPDVLLRGHEQENVLDPPTVPVHTLLVPDLEWVGSQVEDLWRTQRRERIPPNRGAVSGLLGEDKLPLVAA